MPGSSVSAPEAPGDADRSRSASEYSVGPDAPIMEIIRTTRSMRHLAPEPVPEDLLRTIVEAATWAPSGGNWQPAAFVVVTGRRKMSALADLWGQAIDDFRLITESSGIEDRASASQRRAAASIDYMRAHFAETPAVIVICEDPASSGITRGSLATVAGLVRRAGFRRALRLLRARPRFIRREGASYSPAAETVLLAARAHGLGAWGSSGRLVAGAGV